MKATLRQITFFLCPKNKIENLRAHSDATFISTNSTSYQFMFFIKCKSFLFFDRFSFIAKGIKLMGYLILSLIIFFSFVIYPGQSIINYGKIGKRYVRMFSNRCSLLREIKKIIHDLN